MIEHTDLPRAQPPPGPMPEVPLDTDTLTALQEQASVLRADLTVLRADLAQVESDFNSSPGVLLRKVNEQLVMAAIRAEAIAETATGHLGQLTLAGLKAGLGEPAGDALAILQLQEADMRNLREANERLVTAALNSQELEVTALESHRRQIAFLATVAHELRNPLMPLRLAAIMLDRARTDDVAHAKLQATISGQVAQMTRLIGDLLDGSRISTGKFRLERTLVDLRGVLARVVETCQPGIQERNQTFLFDPPVEPLLILGDAVRLVQVFSNLLENASKYTQVDGSIKMTVALHGNAVVVTVTDNGIGITPKALPHVFDMFVRDAHAAQVSEGGLGIGLAVVRELVKAHEGRVVATSAGEGQGSEFVVTLPIAVANSALAAN